MIRALQYSRWTLLLAVAGLSAASADTLESQTRQSDWLPPVDQQAVEQRYGTFSTAAGVDLSDPFAVVSSGSLYQDKQSVTYSRSIADQFSLNCSSSSITVDGSPDELGSDVRAESVYRLADAVTLRGNVHDDESDQSLSATQTSGAGAALETHLPLDTIFTAAVNSDQTRPDTDVSAGTQTSAYDAQLQKPVGQLPLSLILKGHYVETAAPGSSATRLPSLEQSLVWKPLSDTTLQAGLRQEQYQDVPGIDHQLNQALFADWSQKLLGDSFTWHSYAEMINTRSTVEIAESGLGANGTAQPNVPQGGTSLGSTLPVSTTDERVTFSTGPSVQLEKNIVASLQYSSSWDQAPAVGSAGQDQRVSVSLKGSF